MTNFPSHCNVCTKPIYYTERWGWVHMNPGDWFFCPAKRSGTIKPIEKKGEKANVEVR